MKTILFAIILFFTTAFVFADTVNYHQEVSLYPKGDGKLSIHYWMNMAKGKDIPAIEQVHLFNPNLIDTMNTSKAVHIDNMIVYADTLDSTLHCKIEVRFDHIDSLNRIIFFRDSLFNLQDGAPGQKVFTQFIPPAISIFGGFDPSNLIVTYVYDIRGEIITHNATEPPGKKLIWKYNGSELIRGKTISVTYRPYKLKETPAWIFALSGTVLLVVIIFLVRKRKN
jgi:hypothetical protein